MRHCLFSPWWVSDAPDVVVQRGWCTVIDSVSAVLRLEAELVLTVHVEGHRDVGAAGVVLVDCGWGGGLGVGVRIGMRFEKHAHNTHNPCPRT